MKHRIPNGGCDQSPVQKDIKITSTISRFLTYQNRFTEKALKNGFSDENIAKCLSYAKTLIDKRFPVIYSIPHFASLVGYNTSYIHRARIFTRFFYRYFSIKKSDNSKRYLSEPLPSLKSIQIWILKEILYKNKVSRYTKGYVPSKGIKEHVMYHTAQRVVLTLDIKDFFNSVNSALVEGLFIKMGYSKKISKMLSELCLLNNHLPQGAPTSPYISNLILKDFDEEIGAYCMNRKYKYTRYADDLAFSGDLETDDIQKFVSERLRELDLVLNEDKSKIMYRNDPQLITGIIVNQKSQVPKRERNAIRNSMFYIKKFGLDNHMAMTSINKQNYLKHLLGKINYVLTINSRDEEFKDYKTFLKKNYGGRI